jgi:hypothetical protein
MKTFELAKQYLNKEVEVTVDRPLNSKHPKHNFIYEVLKKVNFQEQWFESSIYRG